MVRTIFFSSSDKEAFLARIPLSSLPRGLYLLKVQTDSGSAVKKVVVE